MIQRPHRLFAASLLGLLSVPACEHAQPPAGGAGKTAAAPASTKLGALPPDKLPPLTAAAPDPEKEQYRLDKVFLEIKERVEPRDRPAYDPPLRVLEEYLAEYFRRAGYDVVREPAAARYLLRGAYAARFSSTIDVEGVPIAHKYVGKVRLGLEEAGKPGEIETVDIPEFFTDGVLRQGEPEDQIAVLEMRRRLAKIIWDRLRTAGKVFTDKEIPELIGSLASDEPEKEAPTRAEDIVKKLSARRFAAVPYLLDALTDTRQVRVFSSYPGVSAATAEKLKVHHIADKALEEIFQKVSRMGLDTSDQDRFVVIRGWENEWKRFCPPYRDSPRRRGTPRAKAAGQAVPSTAPGSPPAAPPASSPPATSPEGPAPAAR